MGFVCFPPPSSLAARYMMQWACLKASRVPAFHPFMPGLLESAEGSQPLRQREPVLPFP